MAIQVIGATRSFRMKKNGSYINIEDPNPEFSPDEVMSFMSSKYPELTTSTISGPEMKENGDAVYEFKTTVGTKG